MAHLATQVLAAPVLAVDPAHPLSYQWHPEVWLLVGFLFGAYVYMVRVIGPRAVPAGTPVVTRRNLVCFGSAMLLVWIASDWPMHDISEEYLYSAHMLQHMILSYFVPPLALLATPTWLARMLIGDGRLYRVVRWFAHPVVAGVLFNGTIMILHIPLVVDRSVQSGPLHYSLHVMVVTASLLMWTPVCGPFPELQIGVAGKMIYLFLQSVVPTVPAAWLTFAEGVVYQVYDHPVRLWGISVIYRPAARRRHHEGRRRRVPVDDRDLPVLQRFAARSDESHNYRRGGTDARRRDRRLRRGAAHHGRRRATRSPAASRRTPDRERVTRH